MRARKPRTTPSLFLQKLPLLFIFFAFGLPLFSQGSEDPSNQTDQSDETAPNRQLVITNEEEAEELDKARLTLLYGTNSQVSNTISLLQTRRESALNKELVELWKETSNRAIKREILTLFSELKDDTLRSSVLDELEQYTDPESKTYDYSETYASSVVSETNALINSEIFYLRDLEEKEDASLLFQLVESPLPPSIKENLFRVLAVLGDSSYTDRAITILDDTEEWDDTLNDAKAFLILALGDWKAKESVYRLEEIVQDEEAPGNHRRYAAISLGKIGDPDSLSILEDLLLSTDKDPSLSRYLIESIGYFENEKANKVLLESLRSSDPDVRIIAIKQLGKKKSEEALDAIFFKARFDTETKVRVEAIKALGLFTLNDEIQTFLIELIADQAGQANYRIPALDSLFSFDSGLLAEPLATLLSNDPEELIPYDKRNQDALLLFFGKRLQESPPNSKLKPIIQRLLSYPNKGLQRVIGSVTSKYGLS